MSLDLIAVIGIYLLILSLGTSLLVVRMYYAELRRKGSFKNGKDN